MEKGIVFDIQRFSVHDGPGIRTAVFLKGCNMRCLWCHNPESLRMERQLSYNAEACTGCGACAQVCAFGVHSFGGGGHMVDRKRCTACGQCVSACPVNALKLFGHEMSSREVVDEVMADEVFYRGSGGGVTFTGGEPTQQFGFLLECLRLCRENGVHTCIETNGLLCAQRLKALAEHMDLFLLDYKATGEELHRRLTGAPGNVAGQALEVLGKLGKPVILRCPVVAGINDGGEHFEAIRRLKRTHSCIVQAEIMGYHAAGRHKWHAIGMDYRLSHLESASKQQIAAWQALVD